MKILYHHRTQAEDAQGIHIQELVQAFRDLGHHVEMVALVEGHPDGPTSLVQKMWRPLVRWVPSWFYECLGLAYNVYGYRRLRRMIELVDPDLIYERYSLNTFCGVLASRRFRRPLVLEVNAPLSHEQAQLGKLAFRRLAKRLERWICSHATWTVVVSHVLKEMLRQEGVPESKMYVIHNGVDPTRFSPTVSGERIRQKYALGRDVTIGFVGWFRPWHGLEMLLKVVHETGLVKQGVRLLLVGDGPAYDSLVRYAESHGLLPAVIFTGPIQHQEIAAHIAAMDIAVQPSAPPYACPMKIIEYMGMGKCIVAPDQPNIRELLQPGVTGELFCPGDKQSFQRALIELVRNPDKRIRLGRQAYAALNERGLLWSKNAERVIALYSAQNGNPLASSMAQRSDQGTLGA